MTTQTLVKGIDITAQTTVSGSQLNQLVDAGLVADDKGLNIVTTDTALDTPLVPNPNADYSGVTPIYWINFTWIRQKFDNTEKPEIYIWDINGAADPTFLQWYSSGISGDEALALANTAIANAAAAQVLANSALTASGLATANANTATANVATLQTSFTSLQASFNSLVSSMFANGTILPVLPPGMLRWFAFAQSRPNGWLYCDGAAVSRTDYAALFVVIGTHYGAGDGVNTFNVPDARGRTLVDNGTGSGLSARTPADIGGEETHLLTGPESGIAAHNHGLPAVLNQVVDSLSNGPDGGSKPDGATTLVTNTTGPVTAVQTHNNMMPFIVCALCIKT